MLSNSKIISRKDCYDQRVKNYQLNYLIIMAHKNLFFLIGRGEWGTSLVVQWLRIHLPMQGTRVRALVREDPTCHGATKPMHHNY